MDKLIILDYTNTTVDVWEVEPNVTIDESFIESLGYNVSGCSWMSGADMEIYFHKEILK